MRSVLDSDPSPGQDRSDLERLAREVSFLRAVVDHLPAAVFVKDGQGRFRLVNRSLVERLGLSRGEILGRTEEELAPDRARRGSAAGCFEVVRVPLGPGKRSDGVLGMAPNDPEAAGVEALVEELRRLKELVERAEDVLFRTDLQGRFTYVNPSGARLLGWSPEELCRMQYRDLLGDAGGRTIEAFFRRQHRELLANTYLELPVATREGREVWLGVNVQLVFDGRKVEGFQGIAREITDSKRHEAQLAHRANHDELTGLVNRGFFEAQLDQKLASCRRYGLGGAVIVLDLDRFKDVNDRFGHAFGDFCLVGFAQLLRERFRESDTVARWGGDEFAVLLHRSVSTESLGSIARELLTMIRRHAATADERASITASIGIARFPEHGVSRSEIMARADIAMYWAKEKGRDRYLLWSPEEQSRQPPRHRSQRVRQLREALARRDFRLFAQPVKRLADDTLLCHEVLLRLVDREGRLLEAATFLDLADRWGSSVEIDLWVLDRVVEQLARCESRGNVLAVNLSARSLGERRLLERLERAAREELDRPSRLILDVTESAAVADLGRASEFMTRLRHLGLRFALDDFGVGFSSLYRLKQLPVDFVKIDGHFVRDLARDRADRALVKAIVEVAEVLGKQTIAELVEGPLVLDALREVGIDYAQGFFLGASRPLEEALSRPSAEDGR